MKTKYCDNQFCESEAVETVPVSVKTAGDSDRNFCAACYEAYVIGVQHGRISENPNAYQKTRRHRRKNFPK
jgi:hypothetical protein